MSERRLWMALVVCLAALPAYALEAPQGPGPEMGEAVLRDGQLELQRVMFVPQYETRVREKVIDGQRQTVEYQVTIWRTYAQLQTCKQGEYTVLTVAGQRLDEASTQRLFAEQTPILVISHGKKIDPFYAADLKPETPILYLRPQSAPGGHAGPVMGDGAPFVLPSPMPIPAQGQPGGASPPQPPGMPPRPGIAVVADGKLRLTQHIWRSVPLWKSVPVLKQISNPDGETETVSVSEHVSMPVSVAMPITGEFRLTDCKWYDHEGQAQPAAGLEAKLTASSRVHVLPEGAALDTRFCRFLRPEALIVQTPPAVPEYHGSLSCAPYLEHCLAKAVGNDVVLMKPVHEQVLRQVPHTVMVDGKPQTAYRTVCETVTKCIPETANLTALDAIDGAGHPISQEQLKKRLAKQTPVLRCGWAHVAAVQLELLNPDAIVLKAKPHSRPGAPLPGAPGAGDQAPPPPAPIPVPSASPSLSVPLGTSTASPAASVY